MPNRVCVDLVLLMSLSKPSKSARKREYLCLQSLGERLVGLNAEQLASIALDERLRDAVLEARNIKAHGALRRQKQLIGKLMRQVDPEAIRVALDSLGTEDKRAKDLFRQAEHWRDRIAAEGASALADFFEFTGTENRELRQQSLALKVATNDRARRLARRRIFSEVHRELASRTQDASG